MIFKAVPRGSGSGGAIRKEENESESVSRRTDIG